MKERERILELVKQGILSTEEALDLLETIAKKETKASVEKDYAQPDYSTESSFDAKEEQASTDAPEVFANETEDGSDEEDKTESPHAQLEQKLEALSNEAARYSVKLDQVESRLKAVTRTIQDKETELIHLQAMEDLDELEQEPSTAYQTVRKELDVLEDKKQALLEMKEETYERLQSIKMEQWSTQAKKIKEQLDVPENWKEAASGAWNQLSETISKVGTDVSQTLKKTFEKVSDNVDWEEWNIKVPSLVSTKVSETFVFPNSSATILDFKLANGNVTIHSTTSSDITIEAQIKIYGALDEQTPLEAFHERARIEENEEELTFHVPNKRIRCHIKVYLPERVYDYTAIHVLNGHITLEEYRGKDVYVKNTNGDLLFRKVDAVMLETKGTNGDVSIKDSALRDALIHTINGDLILQGALDNTQASTVNGTIRVTLTGSTSTRLDVSSVNGMVKVAIPSTMEVDGEVATNFGQIYSRLSNEEVVTEQTDKAHKTRRFRRIEEGTPLKLTATSTTGNILLKDSSETE